MKRYFMLVSMVLLLCLLTSCGSENSGVDKTTFIIEMDKNIAAFELIEIEDNLLLSELILIMTFTEDFTSYKEKVKAIEEKRDRIASEAQAIKTPKDEAARDIHSIYVQLIKDRNEAYSAVYSMLFDLDLDPLLEFSVTTEGELDPRWEEFKTNWASYKTS